MIKVGLTGGIGSGKSTVTSLFEILGVPVFNSDKAGKEALTFPKVIESIKSAFGENVILNGMIDKPSLARLVFSNLEKLQMLNSIVHPQVKVLYEQWCEKHQMEKYSIKEAAILFESGAYKEMDKIIHVKCPLEIRISRVMKRDSVEKEEVERRIKNQWTDLERDKKSDFIINNDGLQLLIPQVLAIHEQLKK